MAWCLSHLLYFRIQPSSSYSKEGLAQASAQVANSCSLNKGSFSRWLRALCVRMLPAARDKALDRAACKRPLSSERNRAPQLSYTHTHTSLPSGCFISDMAAPEERVC